MKIKWVKSVFLGSDFYKAYLPDGHYVQVDHVESEWRAEIHKGARMATSMYFENAKEAKRWCEVMVATGAV